MTTLRCPACGHFLGEVETGARLICPKCGGETTWQSREIRLARPPTEARPPLQRVK